MSELAAAVEQAKSKVSNHLAGLRWCGFVGAQRDGRVVRYRRADQRGAQLLGRGRALLADSTAHLAACGRLGGALMGVPEAFALLGTAVFAVVVLRRPPLGRNVRGGLTVDGFSVAD